MPQRRATGGAAARAAKTPTRAAAAPAALATPKARRPKRAHSAEAKRPRPRSPPPPRRATDKAAKRGAKAVASGATRTRAGKNARRATPSLAAPAPEEQPEPAPAARSRRRLLVRPAAAPAVAAARKLPARVCGPGYLQTLRGRFMDREVVLICCGEAHEDAIDLTREGAILRPRRGWIASPAVGRAAPDPSRAAVTLEDVTLDEAKAWAAGVEIPVSTDSEWGLDTSPTSPTSPSTPTTPTTPSSSPEDSDDDSDSSSTTSSISTSTSSTSTTTTTTTSSSSSEASDDDFDDRAWLTFEPREPSSKTGIARVFSPDVPCSSLHRLPAGAQLFEWTDLDDVAREFNRRRLRGEFVPHAEHDRIISERKQARLSEGVELFDDWLIRQAKSGVAHLELILEAAVPVKELQLHIDNPSGPAPIPHECVRRIEPDSDSSDDDDPDDGTGTFLEYLHRQARAHLHTDRVRGVDPRDLGDTHDEAMAAQLRALILEHGERSNSLPPPDPECDEIIGLSPLAEEDIVNNSLDAGVCDQRAKDEIGAEALGNADVAGFRCARPRSRSRQHQRSRSSPRAASRRCCRSRSPAQQSRQRRRGDAGSSGHQSPGKRRSPARAEHDVGRLPLPSFEAYFGAAAELLYHSPQVKADYAPLLAGCIKRPDALRRFFAALYFDTVPKALEELQLDAATRPLASLRSKAIRTAPGEPLRLRADPQGLLPVPHLPVDCYLKARGSNPPRTWMSGLAERLRQAGATDLVRAARKWYLSSAKRLLANPKHNDKEGDYFAAWLRECHRSIYNDIDASDPQLLRSAHSAPSKATLGDTRHNLRKLRIPKLKAAFQELLDFDDGARSQRPSSRRERALAKILVDAFQLRLVDVAAALSVADAALAAPPGARVVVVFYGGGSHARGLEEFWREQGFGHRGLPRRGLVGKRDWEENEPRAMELPWYLHDLGLLFPVPGRGTRRRKGDASARAKTRLGRERLS